MRVLYHVDQKILETKKNSESFELQKTSREELFDSDCPFLRTRQEKQKSSHTKSSIQEQKPS